MIGAAIAAFLLLLVVAYLIAQPFLAPLEDGAEAAQLIEDRDRALALIRDLDMEFATGKLAEDEYRMLRARRLGEAEEIERALTQIVGETVATELDRVEGVTDEDLERAIAVRKLALEDHGCPRCGAAVDADDRFCRRCGEELATAQAR